MHKLICLSVATVLLMACHAPKATADNGNAQGILFEKKTFAELLEMAKVQNKLIFLDAYTSWCGPCKLLKSKTFTDPKAGQFFNKNFINAAFDMEKGEGVEIAKRYKVNAYPTLLILNGDGQLVYFTKGFMPAAELIRFGKEGLRIGGF